MANAFADWKGAFDSVSHKGIQNSPDRVGATNKMRSVIKALYEAVTIRIKIDKRYTDPIKICKGVRAGGAPASDPWPPPSGFFLFIEGKREWPSPSKSSGVLRGVAPLSSSCRLGFLIGLSLEWQEECK